MSVAVLMATFPHSPSFSYLGPPNVPAQEDVALASGPEPKAVGGGHVSEAGEATEVKYNTGYLCSDVL